MFKFLFGGNKSAAAAPRVETQRQMLERLVKELNEVLDLMPEKPTIMVDLTTSHIALDLPEHLADEAMPLPAPDKAAPHPDSAAHDLLQVEASSAKAA